MNKLSILLFCITMTLILKFKLYEILDYVVRQELKVFSDEVIRFGNRSKNPQWHNLERYFEK